MSSPQFKIAILRFPGGYMEHPASSDYAAYIIESCAADDRVSSVESMWLSDTPITMSRNRLVRKAIAAKCDYILMIDSDMSPDCEPGSPLFWDTAWEWMYSRRRAEQNAAGSIFSDLASRPNVAFEDHPELLSESKRRASLLYPPATIAAPYCGPPINELPYVFRWADVESHSLDVTPQLKMFDRDDAATRTGIEEVAALPTGLILYDARVFERLPLPWFAYEWANEYQDTKLTTEDVYQTRNASLHGMPQYVAWDCWAGHVKNKVVRKPQMLRVGRIREELKRYLLSEEK